MGYTPGPFIKLSLAVTVTPFLSVSKETDQHLPFPIPSVSMYLSTWGTSLPLADYALVEFGVVGFLFVLCLGYINGLEMLLGSNFCLVYSPPWVPSLAPRAHIAFCIQSYCFVIKQVLALGPPLSFQHSGEAGTGSPLFQGSVDCRVSWRGTCQLHASLSYRNKQQKGCAGSFGSSSISCRHMETSSGAAVC